MEEKMPWNLSQPSESDQTVCCGWLDSGSKSLRLKKSRERLLLKDPNLLDQVRQTTTDAENVGQRTLKENEIIVEGKELAGGGGRQTNNPH